MKISNQPNWDQLIAQSIENEGNEKILAEEYAGHSQIEIFFQKIKKLPQINRQFKKSFLLHNLPAPVLSISG